MDAGAYEYETMQLLADAGVPCSYVFDTGDLVEDPHLQSRDFVQTVNHRRAEKCSFIDMRRGFPGPRCRSRRRRRWGSIRSRSWCPIWGWMRMRCGR